MDIRMDTYIYIHTYVSLKMPTLIGMPELH